ncbi:hypothetical protein J7J62_08300 [bacterium]|nr:hypothetical protein [bacterium]
MKGYYYNVVAQTSDGRLEHFGFFSPQMLTNDEIYNTVLAVSSCHKLISVNMEML